MLEGGGPGPSGAEAGKAGVGVIRQLTQGDSVAGSEIPPGRQCEPIPTPPMVHGVSQPPSPRGFLRSVPVLLHSYAKLLNALVCGSYNLRAAYFSSCEADLRNIGREGGYLVRGTQT